MILKLISLRRENLMLSYSMKALAVIERGKDGKYGVYINGARNPSNRTIRKIENKLQTFGKEIATVKFI